jgi:hypothetical protein
MKRARVIITEINITKQGQVNHFQIKLPKNATRIIAIESDFRVDTIRTLPLPSPSTQTPFLIWNRVKNPVLGRLKLQSLQQANIFFEEWIKLVWLNGGIDDMSFGLFPVSPYSLNKHTIPKKVNVPNTTTIINGLYTDTIGLYLKQHLTYTIKVLVWVETTEDADGVVFDFQEIKITNA